jgi:hypothetical protein
VASKIILVFLMGQRLVAFVIVFVITITLAGTPKTIDPAAWKPS